MTNRRAARAAPVMLLPPHAAMAPPPGMLVPTGALAGPRWARGLNQKAVNHTLAPAATVLGNSTFTTVRVVLPSNFQADSSVGAAAPTKLNTLAPSTPTGLPRRVEPASCRRRRTVLPLTEMTFRPGARAGAGTGAWAAAGTTTPSSILAAFTAVPAWICLYRGLAKFRSDSFFSFLSAVSDSDHVPEARAATRLL